MWECIQFTTHNTQGGMVEKKQDQVGTERKLFQNLCPENELKFISPATPTGNQTVKPRRENEGVLPGIF